MNFPKVYRIIILPLLLLFVMYFLLISNISGGDIVKALTNPWGIAMLLMIFSSVYVEHIFTSPKNAFINALSALVAVIGWFILIPVNFFIALFYSGILALSGLIYLLFYEKGKEIKSLGKILKFAGNSRAIFLFIALLSFLTFEYIDKKLSIDVQYRGFIYIIIFYLIFIILSSKKIPKFITDFGFKRIGLVKSNLSPNIILVEFSSSDIKINDLVVLGNIKNSDDIDENTIGLCLDCVTSESTDNRVLARIYLLNEPQRNLDSQNQGLIKKTDRCTVVNKPEDFLTKIKSEKIKYYWSRRKDVIALITSNSNISKIRGEVIRHQEIDNAELVGVRSDRADTLIRYQVINEISRREANEDKKGFAFTEIIAHQLGEWRKPTDADNAIEEDEPHRFFDFPRVPHMNSLIFRWNEDIDGSNVDDTNIDKDKYYKLGVIPKSTLPIYLNIASLVSHHTSFLGLTGSGKTTLVLKLLDFIDNKEEDTLVICLDITGEYRNMITDHVQFIDDATKAKWIVENKKIKEARGNAQKGYNVEGVITKEELEDILNAAFKEIDKIISDRIDQVRPLKKIVIFEVNEISNTRASIELTQYFIEGLLEYAKKIYLDNFTKDPGDKDKFKCCLVLEEAHILVPETLGVGGRWSDSQTLVDKISQVALQGRKYNVGFLLISQRTATVKKTVLNQSNTVISFRAYDETSFNFLSSYFGEDYVKEIRHLKSDGDSRYALVSGKAVVADRPVIVEIKK